MPAGRPTKYSPQIADKICERIATSEMGLEQVLEEIRLTDGYAPSSTTIYRWLESNKEFREQSARARRMQAELIHDRAQIDARTALIGVIEETIVDGEKIIKKRRVIDNVQRSQLIVQTSLKRAGQLDPKKYGEKVEINTINDPLTELLSEFRREYQEMPKTEEPEVSE